MSEKNNISINRWPNDDRPREKLFRIGEQKLSDSELLAILIRTGVNGESAVDIARKVLTKFKSFHNMAHIDKRDWEEFKGLGIAKIAQIKAALEIARRFNIQETIILKQGFVYSEDIVKQFSSSMKIQKNEIVKVILCDAKTRIIEIIDAANGTPTESFPIIRNIISLALQRYAAGIVLLHNHPCGEANPTRADKAFTDQLRDACNLMKIKLLDHIIFGENNYYSFDKEKVGTYEECLTKI